MRLEGLWKGDDERQRIRKYCEMVVEDLLRRQECRKRVKEKELLEGQE